MRSSLLSSFDFEVSDWQANSPQVAKTRVKILADMFWRVECHRYRVVTLVTVAEYEFDAKSKAAFAVLDGAKLCKTFDLLMSAK